jgi:biotin transport system substrate-specific component
LLSLIFTKGELVFLEEVFMTVSSSYLINEKSERGHSWLKQIAVILGASVLIALFAPVAIPLPFTPVPLATQGHVVLLLACLLGSKRASLAVLTYLLQGSIGLPVFAGGMAGVGLLAGPRGGYLLGYLAAAFITGFIAERIRHRTLPKAFVAMAVGNAVIYFFGLPRLALFVGWHNAFALGMLPFLIGDAFKLLIATRSLKSLRFFGIPGGIQKLGDAKETL